MAYKPTNWNTGDVITALKLNHIELELSNNHIEVITKAEYDRLTDKTGLYLIQG